MKAQPPAPPAPGVPLQPQWQPLIDSLLEAVCLVEPRGLRICYFFERAREAGDTTSGGAL